MDAADLLSIESMWGIKLPECFSDLLVKIGAATHSRLTSGQLFQLPFASFDAGDILDARRLAPEWDIPANLVPFMGDFHDLVCLDYRHGAAPGIVALDDNRSEIYLAESAEEFLSSLMSVSDAPDGKDSTSGIVHSKSWLNF